eukprot:3398082-Alexandrium_andersonii.AAC.1
MGTLEAKYYQGPFARHIKPGRAPQGPHRIECAGAIPPRPPPLGLPDTRCNLRVVTWGQHGCERGHALLGETSPSGG